MPSQNLQQLAKALLDAATAINNRIQQELPNLDPSVIHVMSNRAQELLMKSKALLAMSVIEIGNEAKESLDSLQQATNQINDAIKTINNVQKVINIASKLVGVAGNIITGNLAGIPASVKSVLSELKASPV